MIEKSLKEGKHYGENVKKIKVKLAPRWISPFGAAAQNGKNIDLIKKMSRNKNNTNSR